MPEVQPCYAHCTHSMLTKLTRMQQAQIKLDPSFRLVESVQTTPLQQHQQPSVHASPPEHKVYSPSLITSSSYHKTCISVCLLQHNNQKDYEWWFCLYIFFILFIFILIFIFFRNNCRGFHTKQLQLHHSIILRKECLRSCRGVAVQSNLQSVTNGSCHARSAKSHDCITILL